MGKSDELKYMSQIYKGKLLIEFHKALDRRGADIPELAEDFGKQRIPTSIKQAEAVILTAGKNIASRDLVYIRNKLKAELDDDYPDYQTILDLVSKLDQCLYLAIQEYFGDWNFLEKDAFVDTYKTKDTQITIEDLREELENIKGKE